MKKLLLTSALIAAALLVPAFALSAYAADFVRPMPTHPIQAGPTLLGGEQPVICSPLSGSCTNLHFASQFALR